MKPRSSVFPILILLFGMLSLVTLRSIDVAYATNQLFFFIVSFLAFWTISSLDFFWWKRTRWWWYGLGLSLLLLTLLIGTTTNAATSWLTIGSYRLQPSELMKPALFLLLGIEAARLPLRSWSRLTQFLTLAAIPLGLILLQPDLGTLLVMAAGTAGVYLFAQPKRIYTVLLSVSAVAVITLAWIFLLQPYQKDRITSFVAPQSDPLGSGYNAQQAMIAVGSGGFWGKGIGNGLQSNLRFLPERHTDFLFATYAESTGFVGATLLLSLYGLLFFLLIHFLRTASSREEVLVILGLALSIFTQMAINVGMNIGVAPITGVPLPLFSLGGSSLLATAISLGMIESIRRSRYQRSPLLA